MRCLALSMLLGVAFSNPVALSSSESAEKVNLHTLDRRGSCGGPDSGFNNTKLYQHMQKAIERHWYSWDSLGSLDDQTAYMECAIYQAAGWNVKTLLGARRNSWITSDNRFVYVFSMANPVAIVMLNIWLLGVTTCGDECIPLGGLNPPS